MARFLSPPRCCGQRLPSRSWELEDGQKVFVRFELGREFKTPILKFLWFEPRKGADGIYSARILLDVFAARIVGAQDQGDGIIVITDQSPVVSITRTKANKKSVERVREHSQISLLLLVAVSIERAALKFFSGRSV